MRDNNRGMKGQDVKRLARVPGFNTLSNFCVSFTQARFAINSKLMLWRAKKTRDHVVGNSGQGMYWQGSDKNPPTG